MSFIIKNGIFIEVKRLFIINNIKYGIDLLNYIRKNLRQELVDKAFS